MLPEYDEILTDEEDVVLEEGYPDTTWILDEATKTIKALSTDRTECITQSAWVALRTEQQEYEIYPITYGSTLHERFGDVKPHVYAEIENSIRKCLENDDRIESVDRFTFNDKAGNVDVAFDIDISTEIIRMEEVVNING